MVKFIAQDVLGWSLFLEICFHSTFLGVTNPFLHRFTQQPCNDTQISRLPTGGRIHGNNRQLLSREGLVKMNMNMGKGYQFEPRRSLTDRVSVEAETNP